MDKKSAVKDSLPEMIEAAETKCNTRFHKLRTDNGGEYISSDLQVYLRGKGIEPQLPPPYSPESNGRAERLNRTLIERARTILNELRVLTGIGDYKKLWAKAIRTVLYVHNRTLTDSKDKAHGDKTPFEIITGEKPNLSHLRILGSRVKVKKPKK